MSGSIGIFSGSASSFNVVRLLSNLGRALSHEFTTHLITTNQQISEEVTDVFDDLVGVSKTDSVMGEAHALKSYFGVYNPDILFQITNPPIHGSLAGAFAKAHDVQFIYRYSGDRFSEYSISQGIKKPIHYGLNNVIGRVPLYLADEYVVLGPTGRNRLEACGVKRRNISIIPPIVDKDLFTPHGYSPNKEIGREIGLFVGRISRRKGRKTIEQCLPEILDRRPDLGLLIVGQPVEHLDISSKYDSKIDIIGSISPERMPQYYRAASFLMHPSLTEGLPRAVLEALACGIPVIGRDVGDIAFATSNTFSTDREFIELVCDFESLDVDPVEQFTFNTVSGKYNNLFKRMV